MYVGIICHSGGKILVLEVAVYYILNIKQCLINILAPNASTLEVAVYYIIYCILYIPNQLLLQSIYRCKKEEGGERFIIAMDWHVKVWKVTSRNVFSCGHWTVSYVKGQRCASTVVRKWPDWMEKNLEALGSSWKYLEVHVNTWKYLEALGSTWKYLEVLGGTWKYLEVLGSTWRQHRLGWKQHRHPGGWTVMLGVTACRQQ